MNKEQMEQLKTLLEEMSKMFVQDADVHKYTEVLGDRCRVFIEYDDKHLRSIDNSPNIDDLIAEIMAVCPEILREKVDKALTSIKNAQSDDETKLPIQDLLKRTWALHYICENGAQLICDNLSHNEETGGGCLPGIAARLVQPYTAFVYSTLEQSFLTAVYYSSGNPATQAREEEEMEYAKYLSLQQQQPEQSVNGAINQSNPLIFTSQVTDEQTTISDEELAVQLHIRLNLQN